MTSMLASSTRPISSSSSNSAIHSAPSQSQSHSQSRPSARTSLPPSSSSSAIATHHQRSSAGPSSSSPSTVIQVRGRGGSSRREDSTGLAGGTGGFSGNESTPGPPNTSSYNHAIIGPSSSKTEADSKSDPKPKKKKRKGWKGWAMVVEDENGNVLEIRDGPEVEADANNSSSSTAVVGDGDISMGAGMSVMPGPAAGVGAEQEVPTGSKEMERGYSNGTAESPLTASSPDMTVATDEVQPKSSSPIPLEPTLTALANGNDPPLFPSALVPKKRPRQPSASVTPIPSPHPILPPTTNLTNTANTTTTESASTPLPTTSTTTAVKSGTTTTAPRHSLPKSKPPRPVTHAQPTRAQPSRIPAPPPTRGETTQPSSTNATPGPIGLLDENPLPKAPRAGAGGSSHKAGGGGGPVESEIRGEALFIIQNAAKHREEGGGRAASASAAQLTPPPTRDGAFDLGASTAEAGPSTATFGSISNTRGNGNSLPSPPLTNGTENGHSNISYPLDTPTTASAQVNGNGNGTGTGNKPKINGKSNTTIRITKPPAKSAATATATTTITILNPTRYHHVHLQTQEEDFETQFARVQEAYQNGIKYRMHPDAPCERSVPVKGLDDANPPRFDRDQSPTVVLVPPEPTSLQPKTDIEMAHREGFEGLPESMDVDAQGFVNNVRDNLRNILAYYFPYPSVGRDAFLEKIGRGLADMGWQLTDSSDAAIAGETFAP